MPLPTVNDIISIASSDDVRVSSVLRKALVLANSLGVKEFETWIRKELNGYSETDDVPNYRITNIELRAKNPYHGWVPVIIKGNASKDYSKTLLIQPICVYENILRERKGNASSELVMPLSPDFMAELMKACNINAEITRFLGVASIVTVVDSVITIILDWGLKLKEKGIPENDNSFSKKQKEEAYNVVQNIMINNFKGILGNADNSRLNIDSIQKLD